MGTESITINNDNNRLTPEDVERMLAEAEKWAEEDKLQKEKIEARNELEQYSYSLKRQVEDKEQLGEKISEEDKEKILEIVEAKLAWLKENEEGSAEEFKGAKKEIEEVSQPIIAALYQQNQGSEGGTHSEDEL